MVRKLLFLKILPLLFFFATSQALPGQSCPVSVSIESNTGTSICEGESIEFTATTNGGTNLSYEWKINGNFYDTGKKVSVSGLKDKDKVKVEVTSSDSPGCKKIREIEITVNSASTGTAKIQASNRNICPGETVNFTITSITSPGNSAIYKWQLTRNGATSIVSTSNNLSDNIFQEGDKIQLLIEPSLPCMSPFSSNIIEITEGTGPPATPSAISGETSVCPGSQITYSVTEVPGATEYVWILPTGWIGTGRSNEIHVTPGTGNGNITVKAKNTCGESSEQLLAVSARAGTPTAPEPISGATELCPGISTTYHIPEVTGATEYLWELPSGWSGTSTSNSITVTTGFQSGTIKVQAGNNCGMSPDTNLHVIIQHGTPATPGPLTGPAEVCPGSRQIYSIAEVSGASEYLWTLPVGWTGTSTSNTIMVTAASSGRGEISVEVKNSCGTSQTQKLQVSIDPEASVDPVLTGNTTLCPGETVVYSTIGNFSSYKWTIPTGWEILQNNDSKITVKAGNYGNNGIVKVTAENSCGKSVEAEMNVSIGNNAPAIPQAITGPDQICTAENQVSYSVSAVDGATSYNWNFPSGWQILSGEGTNDVTVKPTATAGEISVSSENSCGKSSEKAMEVHITSAAPEQPGEITSNLPENLNFCQSGGEIRFSVPPAADATGYLWTLPAGWEIIAGAGTKSITVTPSRSGNNDVFNISVEAVNGCGSSSPRILENLVCEDSFPGDLSDSMFAIYISGSRQLIIRNPGLTQIDNIYLNNLLGQQLDTYSDVKTQEEIKLPVKQFTPGVYLFRIHSEEGILTKQVLLE